MEVTRIYLLINEFNKWSRGTRSCWTKIAKEWRNTPNMYVKWSLAIMNPYYIPFTAPRFLSSSFLIRAAVSASCSKCYQHKEIRQLHKIVMEGKVRQREAYKMKDKAKGWKGRRKKRTTVGKCRDGKNFLHGNKVWHWS